jgi:26S proteasome regulatory subunit N3
VNVDRRAYSSCDDNDMPGKTHHANGNDPVENGINGTKDIEMKEDAPSPMKGGKGKKVKDGQDEEMTVVVPPSKGSKPSVSLPADKDGDVVMDGPDKTGDDSPVEETVDPVTKAITGT